MNSEPYVVGVEVEDEEGELGDHLLEQRSQPGLGDARRGQHHLPLRHLVDGIDMVEALALRTLALVHRVDAQKPRLAVGLRLAALADLDGSGPRLLVGAHPLAVSIRPAQVVEVAVGDPGQALELPLAVDLELALENVPGSWAAQPLSRSWA